jgi:hypothetical protein
VLAIEGEVVLQLYRSGALPVNPDFFRLYNTAESTVAGSQKDAAFGVAFTVEVLVARDASGKVSSSYTDMFFNVALTASSPRCRDAGLRDGIDCPTDEAPSNVIPLEVLGVSGEEYLLCIK